MRKFLLITITAISTFSLASCINDIDEYGLAYNIEDTSIEIALENELTITSIECTIIDYDEDLKRKSNIKIDGLKNFNSYENVYSYTNDYHNVSYLAYEMINGEFIKYPTINSIYALNVSPDKNAYRLIQGHTRNLTDYSIEDNFYVFTSTFIEYEMKVRVNSRNYIDYIKVTSIEDGEEVIEVEYSFNGHNNTIVELPNAEYYDPIQYMLLGLNEIGFTFESVNKYNYNWFYKDFDGSIDIAYDTLVVNNGSDSLTYIKGDNYIDLRLFIGNDDLEIFELINLFLEQSRIEKGFYDDYVE
ncbi:hypothetical protein KQ51_00847 [Candidatus Izimaplasma bacterium HR1]|jgi:hypothetical protein|uniref:hypothetical protein n=1 Tax=Candidatus Izimoplasma sp. HR1 TaxID=1541959 RepID=UPI0004F8E8FD|nr:hypothetical protein KQ51_00847 [Candidatus Izimaplasma bacterium HR1]